MSMTVYPSLEYPSLEEVAQADKVRLGEWIRFLPPPPDKGSEELMEIIWARFLEKGGWDAATSKAVGHKLIGWEP